jgi:hypothetical protein
MKALLIAALLLALAPATENRRRHSNSEVGAATPVARAAIEALWLLFRFSSHRFRPKGGCRPHCDCDDESAVDCASLLALLGLLSTTKPNWG